MAESGVGKALRELDSVPVKRATSAPVAPIPSAPVSLPTSDPLKVQRALDVARPRVMPVLRIDNPGGEWLKNQRRYAEEGKAKVSGPVTGYFNKPMELDPRKLESIPGSMNEQRAPGNWAYDLLRPLIEKQGFLQDRPILVGINHLGAPYIIEGNTRAAVARDLGIDRIPAEVRYFAGGEGVEGPMMPSRLEEFMPPFDPNIPDITKAAGGRAKTPDWQRAAGKNPEGGLNAKGRASYNRDNPDKPGLKRPQPEGGARRDSFCSRMEGMKDKLTSKETASDPNSRINKSLRAWNC